MPLTLEMPMFRRDAMMFTLSPLASMLRYAAVWYATAYGWHAAASHATRLC